jgi:hypothetical protein
MQHDVSPLQIVIDAIADGKPAKLARLLGVHRSTVSGWKNSQRRAKGMCGTIPQKYLANVMKIARSQGVSLPIDLLIT